MLVRLFIEDRVYFRYATPRKIANLLQSWWHYLRRDVILKSYPYRYYIEPTNACNLRCPFCLGWQERSKRRWGMMSLEMYKAFIDQIAPYTYWIDLYNRGEPVLHPDLVEMIAYAHKHGIGTKISSNFHKVDDAYIEQLVRSGLDYLVIPLDGATQETYSTYRVGGDVEVVLQNLRAVVAWKRRLKSKTPYITIRTLIMRRNEHELEEIKRLAHEMGVDNLMFTPMIVNIKREDADQWLPTNPLHSFYDYEKRTNRFAVRKACAELWMRGTLNWDGGIFPCCFADNEEEALGKLETTDFLMLWNSKPYQASRAVFRTPPSDADYQIATVCTSCRGLRKKQ